MSGPGPSALLIEVRDSAPDDVAVARCIRRLARLHLEGGRDRAGLEETIAALARALAKIGAAAEFVARASARLDRAGPRPSTFAAAGGGGEIRVSIDIVRRMLGALGVADKVPGVLPHAAIAELVIRKPELAHSAEEVRRIYSERPAFAAARAVDLVVAKRARTAVMNSLVSGVGEARAAAALAEVNEWSLGYATNVVRTNATTAYAAGRLREARAMAREGLVAALRLDAIVDSRTRPNHAAADGLIASVDDDVWNRLCPPLGYQCRCVLSPLDELDVPRELFLKDGSIRRARIPSGAFPDKDEHGQDLGFGRRPDAASFPLAAPR